MKFPVYLDNNSTTCIDLSVIEAMLPYLGMNYGNASSHTHYYGKVAEEAVENAREKVAKLIHSKHSEIIFTSGATESINMALLGLYDSYKNKGNHIITVKTEHLAVIDTCRFLEKKGAKLTYLDVNADGLIDLEKLKNVINEKTILVCVMYANNETGVIQQIKQISNLVNNKDILFFTDATQAVGKVKVDVINDGIDLMAFSAHKIYGPKGIGALYIKNQPKQIMLNPIIFGGGHEKGLRAGTLNVPGIVGFGKSCEIINNKWSIEHDRIMLLRDELEKELLKMEGAEIACKKVNRLPNTTNISFKGAEAMMLLEATQKKLAMATGSACTSVNMKPSHVLTAMGFTKEKIHSSVRISLGRFNDLKEIKYTVSVLSDNIKKLKS